MNPAQIQKEAILQARALEELKERLAVEAYLSVEDVRTRCSLSREKVEALPIEILPFADFGSPARALRRYHPADVLALDAVLRAWKAAETEGEGEAFLRERRKLLEARDAHAVALAMSQSAA